MSPVLISLVVVAATLGQPTAEDVDAAREAEIHAAIRQLSAKEYATREQAYRQLWRQGLAAEAALHRAAKSGDGETRLRARRLLRDIEFGLLPGTDAATRQLIREFRDGGSPVRGAAFQRLVQGTRIAILERLIRLEPDPEVRRQLLAQMFQNELIVERFVHPNRIDALIETVGGDQDKRWKRAVTIQLMFAPNMLSRLAETGSLDQLLQLIRDETDAQIRQSMLVAIFRTPGVGVVLARNELAFVLDTLRTEPDQKFRGALLGEIFANPQAAQAIVAHKQLDVVLTFSREHTDADSQQKLVELILASSPVVDSLLKEGGIERVIALVSQETDPLRRGRLLGAVLASSPVRSFLQRNGLAELAIKLAKEETNEAARHEFLQALLHDTSFVYSLNNEVAITELWKLIKADQNAVWRAQALIVLLQSHRSNALLQDKEEAAWILALASDDAAGPVREDILRYLLPNVQAQRVLIANGHFDTMLKLARELPIRSRGEILGSFLAGAGVAEHLAAVKRIELLINVAKDETDAAVRQLCLQGVFRNSTAMTALLAAGHYATFLDLIQTDDDAARQANLFAAFVQNYHVMEELAKRGDSKLLLQYAETDQEGTRRQFLPRLFQNHRAVTLLMDQGHFERLIALAKLDGGTNFDEFLVVPKVIEHLAAANQFSLFVDFATGEADDNTRRNLLRNVFSNTKTIEALIATDNFDRLLRLMQAERDATWRATLLGPVISSPQIVTRFATLKKLSAFLSMISDDPDPVVRTRLATYLAGRGDTLNIFVEHGYLDTLISLVNQQLTGAARGSTLASIVTNTKALERLVAEQRVGLLLAYTEDADVQFTTAYMSRLFGVPRATDLLVEHGYYGDVFKLATASGDAKVRAAMIARLLYSQKAIDQMIVRKDVATLVSIVKQEPDATSRRDYLATLCGNDRLIDEMLKSDLFTSLVATLRADPDATARARQLATLTYSAGAITKLATDEQLEQIVSDALAETDANLRENWLSNIFLRSACIEELAKLGYGERLLDAMEKGVPVARQESLLRTIFSNRDALAALIEAGHFDRLVASAKRLGGQSLSGFLRSPVVIEYYVANKQLAVVFRAVEKELDPIAKHGLLYSLLQNEKVRKAVLETGQFEALCELIQSLPDANQQRSLFSIAFSSLEVVKHYADAKTLDRLFGFIEHKSNATARDQLLLQLLSRSDAVDLLIEQGQYETLLRISKERTEGETRDRLLAQLLTSPKGLAKLMADEQVASLLTYATDRDGSVSVAFVSQLLSNYKAVTLLIDQGHFAELYKLITSGDDRKSRTALLGQLLTNPKAIEQLTAAGELAVVVNYAKDETNSTARRAYLERLCSNQLLIAELVSAELLDELVQSCESEPDANERRRRFASLLHSPGAVDYFAATKRLESLVADSLAEPDKSQRHAWLSNAIGNSRAFAAMMKHGIGDQLLDAAQMQLDPAQLQYAYRAMLNNSEAISHLAKSGRQQLLFTAISSDTNESQVAYLLSRVASNEDALQAITSAGELNELLARVAKVTNDSARDSLHRQVLTSGGTVAALAEQNKLPALFELIRALGSPGARDGCLQMLVFNDRTRLHLARITDPEPLVSLIADTEERVRGGIVMRVMSDPNLRRRWIEAGQLAQLEKLLALSPSEYYREQNLWALYYTPSGALGDYLRREKFDEVEPLLRKQSGDLSLSWLAAYYSSRGQLAAEIERLRQQDAESRSGDDTRLLCYLLRASGDLPGATEVAQSIGDLGLLRPLLVEQRRWSEAAALQATAPLPPPVDLPGANQFEEQAKRIEQLGMLVSYCRLAGNDSATKSAIAELLTVAEANQGNSQLLWFAAQALLLNDCIDEGLRLTKASRPLVAFTLFAGRHDYASAFKTIGLDEDFAINSQWYDGLPFGAAQADIQKRFLFAIDVAKTLQLIGQVEAAERVLSLLDEIAEQTPPQGKWPTQDIVRQWYSGGLYRIGLKDRAWSVAAKVVDSRAPYPPAITADIFGSRAGEARFWWMLFQSQHRLETTEQRLARIDGVMNPTSQEALQNFPDLVEAAIQFGEAGQSEQYWRGLADTCKALEKPELAIQCYEHIPDKTLDATIAYADLLFNAQRWAEAAEAYHDAWLEDHDRLALLFLAGFSKRRVAGDTDGEAWQKQAELQAVTPYARHQLATEIRQRGLINPANEHCQILLRTAPFESHTLNDAARELAINAYADEPARAASSWQHYLLGDVRPAFWLLNDISYLNLPALVHKLRARDAIARSDFESAERELTAELALCPGDTDIAEEVVPLLDSVGQSEIADRFISRLVSHYKQVCESHPQSARLHNNLAWTTARCHRHLDLALSHANQAVAFEPNNAGYLDTLAEVHFQLGDRDQAIQWSERALALRPLGKSLQAQLARFRTAPLPTP